MKAIAKKSRVSRIKDSYLDLVREWPLATIKNDSDSASLVLDRLAVRDDFDDGEEQYLEALEMLIEAYDDKHAPIMPDGRSPLERLTALMESSGTTAARLRSIVGASQPSHVRFFQNQQDWVCGAGSRSSEYLRPGVREELWEGSTFGAAAIIIGAWRSNCDGSAKRRWTA